MAADVDRSGALVDTFAHYGVDVGGGRGRVSGPCHEDRVPSVSVNVNKGVWHCFACDAGGDYLSLIMLMEGVGFLGARDIARGWGIGVEGTGILDRSLRDDTGVFRWGDGAGVPGGSRSTKSRSGRQAGFRWD